MNSPYTRNYHLDNLRSIAIFIVVLGHYSIPEFSKVFIYSFHMSLFFFISGYFFRSDKFHSVISLIRHRIFTLFIPYFLLAFAQLAYNQLKVTPIEFSSLYPEFINVLKYTKYWFIPAVFVAELGFYLLKRFIKRDLFLVIVLVALSVFHYIIVNSDTAFSELFSLPGLRGIHFFCRSVVFYAAGYFAASRFNIENYFNITGIKSILCLLSCLLQFIVVHIAVYKFGFHSGMTSKSYFMFYILSFWGIINIIGISMFFNQNKIMDIIGRNTLLIYILHSNPGTIKLIYGFLGLKYNLQEMSLTGGIVCSLGIMILLLPVIFLYEKTFKKYIYKLESITRFT